MISRTMDAAFLNQVANHPDVHPWLGAPGAIDLGPVLANPANVALVTAGGGFVLHQLMPALYEWHSLFLPDHRGRDVVRAMREALRYMFVATDCTQIVTKVPAGNKGALGLVRLSGGAPYSMASAAWRGPDGVMVDVESWSINILTWAAGDASARQRGQMFHDLLEIAKEDGDSLIVTHPDDAEHDAMVGATLLMCEYGSWRKGLDLYNKWALTHGYAPVRALSEAPLVVDIHDAVIGLYGSKIEVLLCR